MHPGKYLAAVFFIFFTFSIALACSCVPSRPPCNYYGSTDAIFLGRVVGSAQRKTYLDENGSKIVYDVGTIRFLVLENYKGAPGYEVEIHSGTDGGDCGYWFQRNETYVVYAYRDKESGALFTSICSRTSHVSKADEDLTYLRALKNASAGGGTLYGSLKRIIGDLEFGPAEEGPAMTGVKVVISGAGRRFETTTNANGEFRATGLPPGEYDAFPDLPSNLGAISNQDQKDPFGRFTGRKPLRLSNHSCAELSFIIQFNGTVSGTVLDAEGKPAKEVQLNLMPGNNGDRERWTWTNEEGRYEFSMVQPGSYLLGFNLKWAPDKDDPYPKTYYPGVKTRSEAALITVGEGERLKGYDMTLPPKLTEREVTVTVVWPDGNPAVGVDVHYEISEGTASGEIVKTNKQGRAVLNLFENYRYILGSTAERNNNAVHSAPIEIVVNKPLEPLKFVLDKPGYGYDEQRALKRKSP